MILQVDSHHKHELHHEMHNVGQHKYDFPELNFCCYKLKFLEM